MRTINLRTYFSVILFIFLFLRIDANDTLRYNISTSAYLDLSDSFGGGRMLSVELSCCYKWFGVGINVNSLHSFWKYNLSIPIENSNNSVIIPASEVDIVESGSFFVFVEPVRQRVIDTRISIGIVAGFAQIMSLYHTNFEYSYKNERFNYLYRDYLAYNKRLIGYQAGLDIGFEISNHISFELKSKIQGFTTHESSFLVGGGFSFIF